MKTKETTTCRKCGSDAKPSKAFNDTWVEHLDLGSKKGDRGNTLSKNGKAELVDCLKCIKCGHSWIPNEDDDWQKDTESYIEGLNTTHAEMYENIIKPKMQYTKFDKNLFLKYINKFSDVGKLLALAILEESINNEVLLEYRLKQAQE